MINELKCESVIVKDVFIADTFIKRFMGYMFRKKPHYEAILIKPCNSIHTFFMKFNIDVLFINDKMEIVKKVEKLKSGRIIFPVKEASMVVEGEAGKFKKLKVGEKISIL